jgi:hypothetical protein
MHSCSTNYAYIHNQVSPCLSVRRVRSFLFSHAWCCFFLVSVIFCARDVPLSCACGFINAHAWLFASVVMHARTYIHTYIHTHTERDAFSCGCGALVYICPFLYQTGRDQSTSQNDNAKYKEKRRTHPQPLYFLTSVTRKFSSMISFYTKGQCA